MPRSAAAAAVTARHAVTPPGRRMTARPETLDVVGGLERFRCLDIMGGTLLSRASCAARWRSETSRASGAARQGATDGPMPHMPCVGCPVGKLHADEQRAGTVPRLTVVRDGRMRAAAPKAEHTTVEAPAAVVPARRPSVRPAAPPSSTATSSPRTTTPGSHHADAQQVTGGGNPVVVGDRSEPSERTSPPVAERPIPPSGEQVAGGRRPGVAPAIECAKCGTVVIRMSPRQRYCPPCGRESVRRSGAASKRRTRERAAAARTGPVQAPEHRPTSKRPAAPPEAATGRTEAPASPYGLEILDVHHELLSLAIRAVLARDARDRASAEYDALVAQHRAALGRLIDRVSGGQP